MKGSELKAGMVVYDVYCEPTTDGDVGSMTLEEALTRSVVVVDDKSGNMAMVELHTRIRQEDHVSVADARLVHRDGEYQTTLADAVRDEMERCAECAAEYDALVIRYGELLAEIEAGATA